jgi:hypothetical protein
LNDIAISKIAEVVVVFTVAGKQPNPWNPKRLRRFLLDDNHRLSISQCSVFPEGFQECICSIIPSNTKEPIEVRDGIAPSKSLSLVSNRQSLSQRSLLAKKSSNGCEHPSPVVSGVWLAFANQGTK